jgi:hypothetical protein
MVRLSIIAVLALTLTGCGRTGPQPTVATGSISLDGKLVGDGLITFRTEDGSKAEGGPFAGGRYHLQVSPGKKKVDIHLLGSANGTSDPLHPNGPLPDPYHPTNLPEVEVKKGKVNEYDFQLRSR